MLGGCGGGVLSPKMMKRTMPNMAIIATAAKILLCLLRGASGVGSSLMA